ncbi:hypothetical protein OHA84_37230 [Streptomyces sp. NBC_00513]|uniref:hypothetical protein n=1 Tax=unclassified Streptomyces TaxID=2593676 RepID=UPI00224DE7C4|nr:hypothetical protein [Streptomyces sp. NBC_00424]MCX5078590.1 hypothetical protein [Streptomyces sp. NBC_00424]WUD39036.1 hypothetical protein OHA84_00070 [Streptomyces sp. NBC_00513]WUD45693.1 hypothetical protein OHA84_37230 [Streptomyces sp. NBC_00513]
MQMVVDGEVVGMEEVADEAAYLRYGQRYQATAVSPVREISRPSSVSGLTAVCANIA